MITDITLTDCQAKRNGRSGFRCQETETLRIYGGYYDANDASGIQIEQETRDVIIDGAAADNNSVPTTGESGFWIDEAEDITLIRCVASNNHFGISVSQSDLVTIDTCDIKDAKQPLGGPWGGLKVNTGSHHSPAAQPFGGVRGLRVKNCEFWRNGNAIGNNKGDIYYGDTEGPTPYAEMEFYDNKVHTNCTCDGVTIDPNDDDDFKYVPFIPEDSLHQPLSFTTF